jgi:hypothetical protein
VKLVSEQAIALTNQGSAADLIAALPSPPMRS